MEIIFKVIPMTEIVGEYKKNPDGWKIELVFESNINQAQTTTTKLIPNAYNVDIRKRIIDGMFSELRQRITEQEDAFVGFLREYGRSA